MKKYIVLVLALVCVVGLVGCGPKDNKNPKNKAQVNYAIGHSEIYDENTIKEAFSAVEKKFSEVFVGCTLSELQYNKEIEDRFADERTEYAKDNLELIVLLSTFTTDENGGDGSLKPNYTYSEWRWYLVRSADNKNWEVRDWGKG